MPGKSSDPAALQRAVVNSRPRSLAPRICGIAWSLALALALVASAASSASARVRDGQLQWTHAENCLSTMYPPVVYAAQTGGDAGVVEPDDGSVLAGDGPFYVRAIFGGIDSDCVGVGGIVSLEFIPPVGVSVVTDPAYPPYWTSISPDGTQEVRQSTPVELSAGPDPGGVIAQLSAGAGGPVWQFQNGGQQIAVYVPLRTTRRLDGVVAPACPEIQANNQLVGFAGDITYDDYLTLQDTPAPAPCPPELAGDNLQVVMNVADTGYPTQIVPYVGLFATQPASSTSPGSGPHGGQGAGTGTTSHARHGRGSAHTLTVRAPRTLTLKRARQGAGVTVNNAPRGKLVSATLTLGARVIAQAVRRAQRNGVVTVVLKPNRANAARLHAGARLRITVSAGGVRLVCTIRLRTAPQR
jgi:hypothetical protein